MRISTDPFSSSLRLSPTHTDPPLTFPYRIEVEEGRTPRIGSRTGGEQLELYRGSDDLAWTKALKFLLSDIKWAIAWSTKHTIRIEGRST